MANNTLKKVDDNIIGTIANTGLKPYTLQSDKKPLE